MKFLEKLQKLDPSKKKMILWSVAIVLAVCFLFAWAKLTTWRLSGITKSQLLQGIPMPNIQIPTFTIPTLPDTLPTDVSF
jgi:hypothetical protein